MIKFSERLKRHPSCFLDAEGSQWRKELVAPGINVLLCQGSSVKGCLGLGLSKAQGLARLTRLGTVERPDQSYRLVRSLPGKHPC